jgi:hypothetical protein
LPAGGFESLPILAEKMPIIIFREAAHNAPWVTLVCNRRDFGSDAAIRYF